VTDFRLFSFSENLKTVLVDNLGVLNLKDVYFVLTDDSLMAEVEKSCKRLEFIKFKQTKEWTKSFQNVDSGALEPKLVHSKSAERRYDHPELVRRRQELNDWIESNKLATNLLEILNFQEIYDLPNLLFLPHELVEAISTALKPIPGRKFKQALQTTREQKLNFGKSLVSPTSSFTTGSGVGLGATNPLDTKKYGTIGCNTVVTFASDATTLEGFFYVFFSFLLTFIFVC
jgi:late competence protein required for DNA uptake (superfamily II DNA/RNA helicase)